MFGAFTGLVDDVVVTPCESPHAAFACHYTFLLFAVQFGRLSESIELNILIAFRNLMVSCTV